MTEWSVREARRVNANHAVSVIDSIILHRFLDLPRRTVLTLYHELMVVQIACGR